MHAYRAVRSSRPAGLFRSTSSTDCKDACAGLTCEKPPADFGLERLATAFMNNPSQRATQF